MVRQRARIRFSKQGDLRLIGHRDLVRALERLLRRAGLRLAMSEGFHPKPRISFPSALALGIEGRREVVELELDGALDADELLTQLRARALPGLEFHSAEILPPGTKKAQLAIAAYEVPVPGPRRAETAAQAERLMAGPSDLVPRAGGPPIDVRPFLEALSLEDGVLRMRLRVSPQRSAGPRDVLAALGLADLESEGVVLTRTDVELAP